MTGSPVSPSSPLRKAFAGFFLNYSVKDGQKSNSTRTYPSQADPDISGESPSSPPSPTCSRTNSENSTGANSRGNSRSNSSSNGSKSGRISALLAEDPSFVSRRVSFHEHLGVPPPPPPHGEFDDDN